MSTETATRSRLLAILAADVAGYSRLMSLDDRGTVAALDAARAVFSTHIATHDGRVIDMAGDSVLAAFETATGAVNAALQIQATLAAENSTTPEDRRMRFRIGIHLGDVIEKADGTVYGDGVNIAARLEGLAEPGSITVSQSVQNATYSRVAARFDDIGEQAVKNIAQPVRAFRVVPGEAAKQATRPAVRRRPWLLPAAAIVVVASALLAWWQPWRQSGQAATEKAAQKSVAVMAFANLSDDKANEYFSDGISDELQNTLSRLPGLRVAARSSAYQFKGKQTPVGEIGKLLGVTYVVEGSVRKAGDRVRIGVQIASAADGVTLWSQNYDRELKDIFAVQTEIARLIARAMQLRIDADSLAGSGTSDPDAWRLYLEARQSLELAAGLGPMTMDHIDRAEKLLEQAIARDPKFARAIATQADVWALKLFRRRPEDPSREEGPALEKIAARAREALALDPKLADAYVTIGNIERTRWHLDADVQNQQRAVELDPNSARAQRALAGALIDNGYMNEGLAAMSRAQVLDPLSPASLDYVVSMAMRTERYGEALPAVEQALLLSPDSVYLRTIKGLLLAMAGRREEALALVRDRYTYFAIRTYALLGERKVLETMLLESRVEARGAFAKPYLLVLLGRNEEALDALEKSELRMSDYATRIQNDPSWDPVREHPRFRALLGSLGVTEAHDRAQAWRKSNPPTLPRAS